jgi:hypothetical protein
MLGGGSGDTFSVSRHHADSAIGDFRRNLDEDKLIVDDQFRDLRQISGIANGARSARDGTEVEIQYGNGFMGKRVSVFLENQDFETVAEWVEIATGEYRKTDEGKKLEKKDWEKMQEGNPIKFMK